MVAGMPVLYSLYVYAPSKIAPVIFTAAFAISAAFDLWQCFRCKAFKLIGLHPLCAALFAAGFALREYGAQNHYIYSETNKSTLLTFILSQVFIYICPPLLELANYHVLGRLLHYVPYCSPLPPSKVLVVFGGLMAVVEALNSLGVSLSANSSASASKQSLGSNLTVSALTLQLLVILCFACLAGLFQRRCIKAGVHVKIVRNMLVTLYVSMTLILLRCIYRLVEHTGSTKINIADLASMKALSPLLRYEYFFYIFEAGLMLANSLLWNLWHPGRFLPRDVHIFLAQDGTEVAGAEESDRRPLIAKVANVISFGLLGVLAGKKKQPQRSQELNEYPAGIRS
ncbi:hypothetical protein BT63DRAFT_434859 [Microthyrium microscopicum]|uniref:RTA1 domain protein n=1 Tax=Microthyrium microscopicum TaxID=703497 RepID=A0A6A6TYZ3_9PEZI|nr:hypothetical protein BT63DRAFT_434859 [Microthyrium microscopicum]